MYLVISCLSTIPKVLDILFVRTNKVKIPTYKVGFYYEKKGEIKWNISIIQKEYALQK